MDEFTKGYIDAAFWISLDGSDPDDGGNPLDQNYSEDDLAPEALERIVQDCQNFQHGYATDLLAYRNMHSAGFDFFLSRNGHGSGFFDRDGIPDEIRERLQEAARKAGECNLYVGDDGKIYVG